jgi:aspartate carbamoyltransferase catalytic subunit
VRHFLSISDLSKDEIELILDIANEIERNWSFCRNMNNKCISSFFAEPSTRTRFSFERAMHWLGGRVITAADASSSSSLTKGESLKDTFRTLGQYSDAIVMRHPDQKWPEIARSYSRVPVINAGSGSGEHPTQALLDLHTIKQKWNDISGLKVLLCGDLRNGRTIHSLIEILHLYKCNIFYCAATDYKNCDLSIPEKYLEKIPCRNVEISDANDILPEIDVIYMTRIQKERFKGVCDNLDFFKITKENIGRVKKNAAILHPLPRNEEISEDIDDDPRADYHERQVRNGLYIRTALLNYLLYPTPMHRPSSDGIN